MTKCMAGTGSPSLCSAWRAAGETVGRAALPGAYVTLRYRGRDRTAEYPRAGYRPMPGTARTWPWAAAWVLAQLRHGLRAARAVRRGAARTRPAQGGAQRPSHRRRVADCAGRHRAEARAAGDLHARLRRGSRSPRPGALAR